MLASTGDRLGDLHTGLHNRRPGLSCDPRPAPEGDGSATGPSKSSNTPPTPRQTANSFARSIARTYPADTLRNLPARLSIVQCRGNPSRALGASV